MDGAGTGVARHPRSYVVASAPLTRGLTGHDDNRMKILLPTELVVMFNPRIVDASSWPRAERRWRWGRPWHRQTPAASAVPALENRQAPESQTALQDSFWHNHYHLEPYYVNGRGYDQYRPAYELGWTAAEKYPGDFASVTPLLEAQWGRVSGASLLDWRQVAGAAHAAWARVRCAEPAAALSRPQLLAVVQGLQRLNRQTVKSLKIAAAQMPQGLLQQVLWRHRQDFESASRELAREFALPTATAGRSFCGSLRHGWESIKAAMGQHSDHSLLDASEEAEKDLLLAYGAALRESLPEGAHALLQRQAMTVQRSIEALHWLRACLPG